MEQNAAIAALSALAQESRLPIFRLLVQEGADGLPAGDIGRSLGIRPNALSFHLTRLRYAGLITARRNGRQILYAVNYEATRSLMGFLTDNCCGKSPQGCSSTCPDTSFGQTDKKRHPPMAETARQRPA